MASTAGGQTTSTSSNSSNESGYPGPDGELVRLPDFVLVDAVRLRDRNPPYQWLVDEAILDAPLDALTLRGFLRLFAPSRLRATVRLVRAGLQLFGLGTAVKILFAGVALSVRPLLWLTARVHKGYRLLFAFLSPTPPLWLDNWTLEEFGERTPLGKPVPQILHLFQSAATYGDSKEVSAYHVARFLDFYLLRGKGAWWFRMCRDSAHATAVSPLVQWARRAGVEVLNAFLRGKNRQRRDRPFRRSCQGRCNSGAIRLCDLRAGYTGREVSRATIIRPASGRPRNVGRAA